jgi:hypothetical protein
MIAPIPSAIERIRSSHAGHASGPNAAQFSQ